ncbi:MAG: response regulator [Chlorobi bacterium]|nr:response regulator [Chlorobiota bacterium]
MASNEFPLIFIIEDDTLFLKMIEEHLKLNDFKNTKSFTSGKDCIEELYYNPDIVIMDYHLDDIDGIELLRKIKKHNTHTYVIMLTISDEIEIALMALQNGAYDYIHKDEISFRLLKSLIEKILDDHKKGIFSKTNEDMTGFKRFLKT